MTDLHMSRRLASSARRPLPLQGDAESARMLSVRKGQKGSEKGLAWSATCGDCEEIVTWGDLDVVTGGQGDLGTWGRGDVET